MLFVLYLCTICYYEIFTVLSHYFSGWNDRNSALGEIRGQELLQMSAIINLVSKDQLFLSSAVFCCHNCVMYKFEVHLNNFI